MTDEKKPENPFEDVERAVATIVAKHLEQVRAIDRADVTVNSWEAEFLDSVLKQLQNQGKPLTQGQMDIVRRMASDYDIDIDL